MTPIPKRKTERAPPIDKLLKPAIGIGLALLGYQFFQGLTREIPRIDVTDELALRHVFFGESVDNDAALNKQNNFVVLCHADDETHISSVFQEAFVQTNTQLAEFRLLDCNHVLQDSNKSIAERFSLNLKQRPTMFVSGHVGAPKQIPQKHLKTGTMLVKALKNLLLPKAVKIETTQDLRTKCLSQNHCALLLKGHKTVSNTIKQAMQNLVTEFPKVTFAAVDTSNLFVRNLEEYLPEYQSGVHRFVVFHKVPPAVSNKDNKDKDRLKTSIAPLNNNLSVNYSNIKSLVTNVLHKTTELTPIPVLPVIKTRTKKIEEEERAKRQRKEAQHQRQQQQQQQHTGGAFHDNDGSREGRRSERDRRRQEHLKNNPNYKEKTPEELQEMERQRRIRMEQEAAKWNVAPEEGDEPVSGESTGESGFRIDEEDEGEWVEVDRETQEGDEDEDVLDLD